MIKINTSKMSDLVATILSSVSTEKEVISLQQLVTCLSPQTEDRQESGLSKDDVYVENEFLEADSNGTVGANPFPDFHPETLCNDQEELNRFCHYVFDRRFGWSETDTEDGRRVRRLSSTGIVLSTGDGHQKAVINTLLDRLVKWFLHQALDESVLLALKFTIKQVAGMPVVRNRTVIHMMEWLRRNSDQLCDTPFPLVQELILLALTDVWSAIRNACACRLGGIAAGFSLDDVEKLFLELVQVCCTDSPWQAKEGAILGINALLQRFLQNSSSSKSPLSSPRPLEHVEGEAGCTRRVPEFISRDIHSVVFALLSHSQLTIREHAARTLATYITCSSIMDALSTFREVVLLLRTGAAPSGRSEGQVEFLDDYAAEGFIGVCIFLVKVLPLGYLLPGWPEYISTFLQYTSHPASTVRQAASSVFKYLVVKSSHSVVVLKLILQALATSWSPSTEHMTAVVPPDVTQVGHTLPSVQDNSGCPLSNTWEGREGRMFSYELILKFIIKNHWIYTFGPAGPGLSLDDKDIRENAQTSHVEGAEAIGQLSTINDYHNQAANAVKPVHHVESEKSLVVKFLTQVQFTDLDEDVAARGKQLDRMTSLGSEASPVRSAPLTGRFSPKSLSPRQYENTCSLLTQAQIVDSSHSDAPESERPHCRQQLQLTSLKKILEKNKNSAVPCRCHWLEKEYLQDMARILKVVLYQTAECLGASQWELRRIANQVLPCLGEVIRWYDVRLLVSVWDSYLSPASPICLMTFTSVLLLRESAIHAIRLASLLHRPPHSWQDHEHCRDCVSRIINSVQQRLPYYLPHIERLLGRPCCDKLSVLAADIILMAHEHFSIPGEQRSTQYASVLSFWKKAFYFAHPQTRISTELLETELKGTVFLSPFEGYLSCCLVKPDSKLHCARQVEKLFVSEVHSKLLSLLQGLPIRDVVKVAPILAHYIGLLVEDSYACKTVAECLSSLTSTIVDHVDQQTDKQMKHSCLRCIHLTLKELAAVVTMKSMDLPQVQKILAIYQQLCKPVNPSRHLRVIFTAISARLNETVQFTVEHSPRPSYAEDDLSILSNEIPGSFSPQSTSDSDEEVIVGTPSSHRFPESLTLNTSNNSGSLASGRLSALSLHSNEGGHITSRDSQCSEEAEESSDWDSWDEDEESQSAFSELFSEFLKTLQKFSKFGRSEFLNEAKKLGDRERAVVLGLLKT